MCVKSYCLMKCCFYVILTSHQYIIKQLNFNIEHHRERKNPLTLAKFLSNVIFLSNKYNTSGRIGTCWIERVLKYDLSCRGEG